MATNLADRSHFKGKNKILPTFLDGTMNHTNVKLVIETNRHRDVVDASLVAPVILTKESVQLQGVSNLGNSLYLSLGGALLLQSLGHDVQLSLSSQKL